MARNKSEETVIGIELYGYEVQSMAFETLLGLHEGMTDEHAKEIADEIMAESVDGLYEWTEESDEGRELHEKAVAALRELASAYVSKKLAERDATAA